MPSGETIPPDPQRVGDAFPEDTEGFDGEAPSRGLLRARAVAALALATAGMPFLSAVVDAGRVRDLPAWGGVSAGWLALALCAYVPLYLREARWPLRCSLGSSLWAAAGAAYGSADLVLSALGSRATPFLNEWLGALLALLFLPSVGALLYRWIDAREGYQTAKLPLGIATGGLLALGLFGVSGLLTWFGGWLSTQAFGKITEEAGVVLNQVLLSSALLGLQLGVSFGLAGDEIVTYPTTDDAQT